ncbi:MAG: hypothetical protein MZV64_30190 [Ignavibacteriales bacterium]|nr:hypothetical protein [Ignavibacteriales bacterium]
METWQEVLRKNSIASLERCASQFGPEHFPELDRLRHRGRQLRVPDLAGDGGLDQVARRPDLAAVRAHRSRSSRCVDGIVDSLNEDEDSPVPNITHRYPDRVLFPGLPGSAPMYCRFCTRKRKVGDPEKSHRKSQFEAASTTSRSTPRSAT